MGAEIELDRITVDKTQAKAFAARFDPLKEHLRDDLANIVLPKGSASGLYILLCVNRELISRPEFRDLLCGSRLSVVWRQPLLAGDELVARAHYSDKPRTVNGESVIERTTIVRVLDSVSASERFVYTVVHLLRSGHESGSEGDAVAIPSRTLAADVTESELGQKVLVSGRAVRIRRMRQVVFIDLSDTSGSIQVVVRRSGELQEARIPPTGAILEVVGVVGTTETGQRSVFSEAPPRVLSLPDRPPPDKWHGASNEQLTTAARVLPLMNENLRSNILARSETLHSLRRMLRELRFVEVESGLLLKQPAAGSARPLETYSTRLGRQLYLRGTCEVRLKQLVVAGVERVFEAGRVFRNESPELLEFTLVEAIAAYSTQADVCRYVKQVLSSMAMRLGELGLASNAACNVLSMDWQHVTVSEATTTILGREVELLSESEASAEASARGVGPGENLRDRLAVKAAMEFATSASKRCALFLNYLPKSLSPLARAYNEDSQLASRGYLFLDGLRLCEIVQEENDWRRQLDAFERQNVESHWGPGQHVQQELVDALRYGCPPMAGFGLNLNRLLATCLEHHKLLDLESFPLTARPISK
ncbi:MAG: hypothetical protein DMF56_15695 [Acidobacteria bacterium]|nr:MAG: hypothetical protein DMF56_15695 [Acidobacteriota bacterium]